MQSFQKIIPLSALLISVGAGVAPLFKPFTPEPAQAQPPASPDASFPIPATLPSGATVNVDGSSSMEVLNQSLKQRFVEKFPNHLVNLAATGSDASVKALVDGKVNVAALGRPLTAPEKAQGIVLVPASREKIAIIVSADNPFKGNITFNQFAKMFRGEITDWSQVGGQPGKIRFIDRPETSDTRRALGTYQIFKQAPFENGATTVRVTEDSTAAVVKELGKDGISYAIADQVDSQPDVRIMVMHGTLPDDPRYPYSQPRGYAYKRGVTDAATLAFLGLATTQPGAAIAPPPSTATPSPTPTGAPTAASPTPETSPATSPEASPETAQVPPTGTTATPEAKGGFPWWLLLLPLLGGLIWWFFKGRGAVAPVAAAPVAVPPPVPVGRVEASQIILTPRNCRHGYAYWEVPERSLAEARQQGGRDLKLRLYDVTGIADMDRHPPHEMKEFDCHERDRDLQVPIPLDDRDYVVELGYLASDNRWIKVARSASVRVPACPPATPPAAVPAPEADKINPLGLVGGAAAAAAIGGISALAGSQPSPTATPSRMILTARDNDRAYAYWEVSEADKLAAQERGGQKMMVRYYNVTAIDMDTQAPHSVQQFDVDEADQDKHLPIPVRDQDYIAEVGYVTEAGHWLKLARSNTIRVPIAGLPGGLGVVAATGAAIAATSLTTPDTAASPAPPTNPVIPPPVAASTCAIQNLIVHSRHHCYQLTADRMQQLQDQTAVTQYLDAGHYIIRIKQGVFGYGSDIATKGEPIVLLWIHGGKFINSKTNVAVNATWSTLNGYDETLCLQVLEPATLHAFFFDTYANDNNSEVIVSVVKY